MSSRLLYIALFTAVLAAGLGLAGALAGNLVGLEQGNTAQWQTTLSGAAADKGDTARTWLKKQLSTVQELATDSRIIGTLSDALQSPGHIPLTYDQAKRAVYEFGRLRHDYSHVYVFNTDGQLLVQSEKARDLPLGVRQQLAQVYNTGLDHYVMLTGFDRGAWVLVTSRVLQGAQKLGYVGYMMNAADAFMPLVGHGTRWHDIAFYLARRSGENGVFIANLSGAVPTVQEETLGKTGVPVFTGMEPSFMTFTPQGQQSHFVYVGSVPGFPFWQVVASVPTHVARTDVRRERTLSLIAAGIVTLLLLTLLTGLLRRIFNPRAPLFPFRPDRRAGFSGGPLAALVDGFKPGGLMPRRLAKMPGMAADILGNRGGVGAQTPAKATTGTNLRHSPAHSRKLPPKPLGTTQAPGAEGNDARTLHAEHHVPHDVETVAHPLRTFARDNAEKIRTFFQGKRPAAAMQKMFTLVLGRVMKKPVEPEPVGTSTPEKPRVWAPTSSLAIRNMPKEEKERLRALRGTISFNEKGIALDGQGDPLRMGSLPVDEQGFNHLMAVLDAEAEASAPPSDEVREAAKAKMIQRSLESGRIRLVFQPIIDLKTSQNYMFETLLRVLDDDSRMMAPGEFIPLAIKHGFIGKIDDAVIEASLRRHMEILSQGKKALLSINLSYGAFNSMAFMRTFNEGLASGRIRPDMINFEVASREIIEDARGMAFIKEMREHGCRFSVDYFGGGKKTIQGAKALKFDYVKLDCLKFKGLEEGDPEQVAEFRDVALAAQETGMPLIAEKVENKAVFWLCKRLNIPFVQGFFIAEPSPKLDLGW